MPNSQLYYLGSSARSATDNSGVVDHIAFLADDPEAFAKRFESLGMTVRKRYFAQFQLYQMLFKDPDGLTLELNFNGVTADSPWSEGSENYAEMPRVAQLNHACSVAARSSAASSKGCAAYRST